MTQLLRTGPLSALRLLDRVLESPQLIAAVRELDAPTLGRLIQSVGLEDAAELVALASTAQLEGVFDEDLWRLEPGRWEESFDVERFALWLHAFAEAGDPALVERLVELPLDFVVLAVHRLILVIDIERLAVEMSSSDDDLDQLEKALDSCLSEEWEEFRLIARNDRAWDDITRALLALDRDHHALLRTILERCSAMSSEWIEDNGGLYDVLSSDEMLENDQRAERDDRRGGQGYVSPADARAFLALARRGDADPSKRDAVTNAYFRALTKPAATSPVTQRKRSRSSSRLINLLQQASGAEPGSGSSLCTPNTPRRREASENRALLKPKERLLDTALAALRLGEPEIYALRMDEIGYLTNVLIAAPDQRSKRLRPVEAVEAALDNANRGLERLLEADAKEDPVELLRHTTLDILFRRGYG